jgi:cytochrome b
LIERNAISRRWSHQDHMVSSSIDTRRVDVWDAPTRLFHWTLVVLILSAWLTAESEAGQIHVLIGETVAGLLVFRLIWGFVGGEHARFSDFAAGPNAIVAHIGNLWSAQPKRHLGHNPLGGLAVLLLLLTTVVIVATGLFSGDDEMRGPLSGLRPDLEDAHEIAFRVLQALVVVHILGVIVETLRARDPLVPAMIRGWKARRVDEAGADAKRASAAALVFALACGVLATATLATMTLSAPAYQGGYLDERHDEND